MNKKDFCTNTTQSCCERVGIRPKNIIRNYTVAEMWERLLIFIYIYIYIYIKQSKKDNPFEISQVVNDPGGNY